MNSVTNQDVTDAVQVLRNLVSTGISLSDADIKAITDMDMTGLAQASALQIASFSESYSHISALVQPVMVKDLISEAKRKRNQRLGLCFQIVSFILLCATVACTLTWSFGTTYLTEDKNLNDLFSKIPLDVQNRGYQMVHPTSPQSKTTNDVGGKTTNDSAQDNTVQGSPVIVDTNPPGEATPDTVTTRNSSPPSMSAIIDAATLIVKMDTADGELHDWNNLKLNVVARWLFLFNFSPQVEESGGKASALEEAKKKIRQSYIEPQKAAQSLKILSLFVLPTLYGILGGCIFTLRRLNNQIELYGSIVSFHVSKTLFRIGLGGCVGFTIGLVETQGTDSNSSGTPFALSLAAGFSMDVLFSFLEALKAK